jgi:hypothetical protein
MFRSQIRRCTLVFALALAPAAMGCGVEADDRLAFEADVEDLTGKADTARSGRFETFQGQSGKFFFHLLAANGQKVLQSQGYTTVQGAESGITSVRANGVNPAAYELVEAQNGDWFFRLEAQNGQAIGRSELYVSRSNAERALNAVVALVKSAPKYDAATGSRFQVFRGLDAKYYFHLRAQNGEIVLQSQAYSRKSSAQGGIASVRTNGTDSRRFVVREAADGQYYFVLTSSNGQTIGVSELFVSRTSAERAVQSIVTLLKSMMPV